jgi:hypothetical protein
VGIVEQEQIAVLYHGVDIEEVGIRGDSNSLSRFEASLLSRTSILLLATKVGALDAYSLGLSKDLTSELIGQRQVGNALSLQSRPLSEEQAD